jgi:tetratricopeptide (TPR) repeat protein
VERAIELIPNKPEVYGLAANIYVQTKQFSRAAELLGKLAGFQPENPTIYLSLGDVLYQAGKPDQAREQWKQALQHVATGDGELRKALIDRLEGRITGETFQ